MYIPGDQRRTASGPCCSYYSQCANGHGHSSNAWFKRAALHQSAQSDSQPGPEGLDTGALGMTEVKLAAPTIGSSWLGPAVLKNPDQGGEGHRYRRVTDRRGPREGVRNHP